MKLTKKQRFAALIAGGALFAIVTPGFAVDGGHDMAGMNHHGMAQTQDMPHCQGGMIMLGEQKIDGAKAMFHLMPIDSKVLPTGNTATHHLMVMFNDAKTGKSFDSGTVAVKVGTPAGKEGAPLKMMGMQGHFGLDVNLDHPGMWHFRIATKLADGKVRQYHSHYVVK